ncbi:MAG: DUF5916 domain-containing protein, partial [Armatimonadota bacterium]
MPTAPIDHRPVLAPRSVPLIAEAPRIDGDLGDSVWKSALRSDRFVRFGGDGSVEEATDAWLATDGNCLYIAFRCHDSAVDKIRVGETQRGGNLADDDHVAVRLDSQNTHQAHSIFQVNAAGTQSERLEGGTGSNWTWSGNWSAAVRRDATGWNCEMRIPFSMLRYPKGARGFSLALMRRLGRETNPMVWPEIAREGQTENTLSRFLPRFDSPPLPGGRPAPTFLPFVLASAGDTGRGRVGVDVKLPVSTTLTGVVALRPDFQTVENDVAQINFSYNELQVRDQRPFFAEGAEFMPDSDLFYSRRLSQVDQGLKLVGRNGNQTIGFIATNADSGSPDRTSAAVRLEQAFTPLSRFGFAATADQREGAPRNRVGRAYGQWGTPIGRRTFAVSGSESTSWIDDRSAGDASDWQFSVRDVPGRPVFRYRRSRLDADFTSNLGLLVDRDRRSEEFRIGQGYRFDRGPIEIYNVESTYSRAHRQAGAFFYDGWLHTAYVQSWTGIGFNAGVFRQERAQVAGTIPFADRIDHVALLWNRRNQFRNGGAAVDSGRQQGKTYRFRQIEQGIALGRTVTLRASHAVQQLDSVRTRQTIVTCTWRLTEGD